MQDLIQVRFFLKANIELSNIKETTALEKWDQVNYAIKNLAVETIEQETQERKK